MIEIITTVHDNFSIEFKVGFVVEDFGQENNFSINTWIFIPNSLDVTSYTYKKDQFYRDVKSNVRLITPSFELNNIAGSEALPKKNLQSALERLVAEASGENVANFEYHIKMYSAIVRSAIRDQAYNIKYTDSAEEVAKLTASFIHDTAHSLGVYRDMWAIIKDLPDLPSEARNSYSFGDEFMGSVIEDYSFMILKKIESFSSRRDRKDLEQVRSHLESLIRHEVRNKRKEGYPVVSDNERQNRNLVFRQGILKKYVESDLYIQLNKKKDGLAVEQVLYSIAAGIAMIFATIVAFSAQMRYGSFSMPLFIALVISYMLKDRIKELTRYYFAYKLGNKYFDNKADINIKGQKVGWLKEGVDFIGDNRTPPEVLKLRNRSSLMEAENKISDEKIILYRKMVSIDSSELEKLNDYPLLGVNNIFRINFSSFAMKMDDLKVLLSRLKEDGSVEPIPTQKIYYINIVTQFQYMEQTEYKRIRITMCREGIIDVEQFNQL